MKLDWHGDKISEALRKDLDNITESYAQKIEAEAKRLCPVGKWERGTKGKTWKARRPGQLRDSIKAKKSKFKGHIVSVPGQGSDVYYSRWVELGAPARSWEEWQSLGHDYPVPKQPFLKPAFNKYKKKAEDALDAAVRKHTE